MIKHLQSKAQRSAAEIARLRADRARYQRDKPTPEQLLTEGGHSDFVRLGDLLLLHQIVAALKKERVRRKMTLAQLADRTGIDQAALSRLENGKNANPTFETILRIAGALGKTLVCHLQDAPVKDGMPKKRKSMNGRVVKRTG
jgi:DNA-binding Xre family transcriptional regulator